MFKYIIKIYLLLILGILAFGCEGLHYFLNLKSYALYAFIFAILFGYVLRIIIEKEINK